MFYSTVPGASGSWTWTLDLGKVFAQLGLNETDTVKFSSILIYYITKQTSYTYIKRLDAEIIIDRLKCGRKV